MLQVNDLEKFYRTEEVQTIALNKLSFEVKEGEFVAIMGPSGCGKSTLLNILGLLDSPDGGSFKFNGEEISKYNERKRSQIRKHNVGFVFQSFNLIDELTVFENVELPLILNNVDPKEREKLVSQAIESVGLSHRRDAKPTTLSGGECQRTAIARAIVHQPALILADEPTANLDAKNAHAIIKTMKRLNRELGTTFVFSTHDEKVMGYLDRIISLEDGSVVKDELIANPEYSID